MKFCKFNKNLIKILVIGFILYSAVFSACDFQVKRINQFVTYAQPKAAKEATTTEALNQMNIRLREMKEHIMKLEKRMDQVIKETEIPRILQILQVILPYCPLITLFILIGTAFVIWWQVQATRKARQHEIFMSLVSELNKIKVYPKGLPPNGRQKMRLIAQLHNYLDGVEDIIRREGRLLKLKLILKMKRSYQVE